MCNLHLSELARPFGEINTTSSADLEHVRALIGKLRENNPQNNINSNPEICRTEEPVETTDPNTIRNTNTNDNWCFVDSVTAIRFFRIDRAQV